MRQAAGTCGCAVRISREIFAKSSRIRCFPLLTVNFLFVIKLYLVCEHDMAASASGFCVLSGAKCVRRFRAGVPAACLTAARGILRRSAQKPPQSRLHLRTPVASVSGAQILYILDCAVQNGAQTGSWRGKFTAVAEQAFVVYSKVIFGEERCRKRQLAQGAYFSGRTGIISVRLPIL